jgi:hypothetical protein
MILAVALMSAQAVTASALPADDAEIVVTAQRLSNRWSGQITYENNENTCNTVRSTGDDEFDTIGCTAMLKCWPEFSPRIETALKAEIAAGRIKTRADMKKSYLRPPLRKIWVDMGKCIQPKIRDGIRAEIKRRKADGK